MAKFTKASIAKHEKSEPKGAEKRESAGYERAERKFGVEKKYK